MKDILATLLGALLTFTLASPCSGAPASPDSGRSLILFYSLSGNTRLTAEALSRLTGAPLAEIKTVEPYPDDFHAVVEQARQERSTGYLPPLLPLQANLNDYDTIYLGFPIWSNSIPQPMATFLSEHPLEGKTILPFCTHGGLDREIPTTEEGRLRFDDGDITYCPQNNSVALFYAQTSRPNLTMKVIPMGRVTSDLAPLHKLPSSVIAHFSLQSAQP